MAANIDGLALYPLAFGSLVLSKGQNIAKSALVPAVVDDESELVRANSRLQLISVLAGTLGAGVAAGFLKTVGGSWVLRAGAFVFFFATILSSRIPRAKRVQEAETTEQRRELQAASIVVAGTAMGLLRGVVGFMTFFVGFLLKKQHEPAWVFGLVLSMSATGNGIGVLLAPLLRKKIREEWILTGSILVPAVLLVFAARAVGRAPRSRSRPSRSRAARPAGASCSTASCSATHDAARGRVRALRDPLPARLGRRRRARGAVPREGARRPVPARAGAALRRALVSRHHPTAPRGRRRPASLDAADERRRRIRRLRAGTAARRHLRGRTRSAGAPPPPATVTDDPPDAFPAGG